MRVSIVKRATSVLKSTHARESQVTGTSGQWADEPTETPSFFSFDVRKCWAMSPSELDYDEALARATAHALAWLGSVGERPVGPTASADQLRSAFGETLPERGCNASEVVDLLAGGAEPGLMAIGSDGSSVG